MTTSPPEPDMVKLHGVNYLLYISGIKRGHAEACEEQATAFKTTAQKYREGASAMDSDSDTFRLTAIAEVLDGFGAQMVATGAQARGDANAHMVTAVGALKRQSDEVSKAEAMVSDLQRQVNRLTLRRRIFGWMSTRLARLAG